MSATATRSSIKKINIELLKPGMFIHDLDCGWLDHPFLRNRFAVNSIDIIQQLHQHGIREVYIDTSRGLDIAIVPDDREVQAAIAEEPASIGWRILRHKSSSLARRDDQGSRPAD